MSTTRSAIVLYSKIFNHKKGIFETYILIGKGSNGFTTIGGRRNKTENKITCLIRELKEETRNILDYSSIPEFFTTNCCDEVVFANCSYFMVPCTYERLLEITEDFEEKPPTCLDSDELSSLNVFEIKDLIWRMVKDEKFQINPTFEEMYLSVGFDWLSNSHWNKEAKNLNCRDFVSFLPFSDYPPFVSLHPVNSTYVKKEYGIISENFVISDQYYGFINNEHLFRKTVQKTHNA